MSMKSKITKFSYLVSYLMFTSLTSYGAEGFICEEVGSVACQLDESNEFTCVTPIMPSRIFYFYGNRFTTMNKEGGDRSGGEVKKIISHPNGRNQWLLEHVNSFKEVVFREIVYLEENNKEIIVNYYDYIAYGICKPGLSGLWF